MAFFAACGITAVASAQTRTIRVVTYNIEADTDGYTTPLPGLIAPSSGGSVTNGGVLEGIGEEIVGNDPAQPIDILALQETTSNPTTVQPILDGLNAFCTSRGISAVYAMSGLQLTSTGGTGGGPSALVYNTNTVQLLESVGVGTPSGSGEARQVGRYLFAPAGVPTNASSMFYVYVSHYKSGTDSSSITRRTIEAGIIRTNSATLAANSRVLYVGDYNISTSTETSYQDIVSTTLIGIQGFDPFNPSGTAGINWAVNSLLGMKSESATDLQYRDDLEVMSSNVYYSVAGGLAYVSGTYHTFGNNGTTPYEGSVNSGSNTSLNNDLNTNVTGITASQLYQYLTTASDHLPVVADYTIPVPAPAPVASFTASPTSGTAPLTVTFTDASTGIISNWFWSFGDGSTTNITTNSVVHTYGAGVYTVTEVVSGSGGSGTNTQPNYITAVTPAPVASFTGSPTSGTAPLTVMFTDTSTGIITNWFWSFGDGGQTNVTTNSVLYTYAAAGTYTVTEIVTGPGGSGTNTQPNYITVVTPAPVASFTGSPTSGTAPLTVMFTDTSTGIISNRYWSFGDGGQTNVTTNSVLYTYAAAGTYTVTEIVSGSGGSSTNTQSGYITVLTPFQAWQLQYFNCTNCPQAAPDADPLGKGMSNTNQFLAGLNPTNSASALRIISILPQGDDVVITWATAGVRTNAIQATLGDGNGGYTNNFIDISGSIMIPVNGDTTTNFLDAGGATNTPSRYYRIRLVP
jgi:PKD repeat protein